MCEWLLQSPISVQLCRCTALTSNQLTALKTALTHHCYVCCCLLVLQLPYEQLRLLLEQRSSEVEVLRNRLEQREASLEALKKNYESQVGVAHRGVV